MAKETNWKGIGGNSMYAEKVFPNGKVGHVDANIKSLWRASLDGIGCGSASTKEEAQELVELEWERRYNGILGGSGGRVLPGSFGS